MPSRRACAGATCGEAVPSRGRAPRLAEVPAQGLPSLGTCLAEAARHRHQGRSRAPSRQRSHAPALPGSRVLALWATPRGGNGPFNLV
jgi:hypothetical protein